MSETIETQAEKDARMIAEHRASGGRATDHAWPILLLHTIGAKTGTPRVTPLGFTRDGDSFFVYASSGGSPCAPGWYFNVLAAGGGSVELEGGRYPVRASEILGAERDEIWAKRITEIPPLADLERRAGRKTPVVRLVVDTPTA
jgi:deazaflavin-dependent oxidoreductase (nitroreductase family)